MRSVMAGAMCYAAAVFGLPSVVAVAVGMWTEAAILCGICLGCVCIALAFEWDERRDDVS